MHHHCSRWPILSLTVWFIQYRTCECLGQSSRIFFSRYQLLIPGLQRTCTWWTRSRRRRPWRRWGATLSPGTSMSTQGIDRHSKVWRLGVEWSKRKTYICLREKIFFFSGNNIHVAGKNIFVSLRQCLRKNMFVSGRTDTTSSSLHSVSSSTLSMSLVRSDGFW